MNLIGNGGHAKVVRELDFIGGLWIVAIGDNAARKAEAQKYFELGYHFASRAVHKSAVISPKAVIGLGTVIMAGAVVQPGVQIGKHVIVNTLAGIDHECIIGDYAHIAPGCHLCGNVTVGEGAFLGAGCIVVPGAVIEPWSFHKAGSVIK